MSKTENELKERLSSIFGWNVQRVELTPFMVMIEKLVEIVEDYEKIIQLQNENIEESKNIISAVEKFLGQRIR
jgi:hypothetical protein